MVWLSTLLVSLVAAGAGSTSSDGLAEALARALATPAEAPRDARLEECTTLEGYFPFTPPKTIEEWKVRSELVRRRVLVAAGLWPMPRKTPLNPVIHGRIDRDAYTVEKVYFESVPGFYVTGNLYRPTAPSDAPRPAVLSPHGHFRDGRFCERNDAEVKKELDRGWETGEDGARYHIQARCAQLARMGCVVFHYDMVGFADSRQLPHGGGFGDVDAELRLQSAFGVQTWNSIRALDFLCGLPDVDPEHIGVTGASGGGTQTFILCAIDDRPAATFPAVMASTAMQGGCVCENASHLRVGTGNIELAALFAPRPLALTGANDWTVEIETKGYPELKELYRLLGAPENVFVKCRPDFEHNYNQYSRELMYAWFNRHLDLGWPEPIREQPLEPIPPAELTVFDDAHPLPENAIDVAGVREWWTEVDSSAHAGSALEILVASELPDPREVGVVVLGEGADGAFHWRELVLVREGTAEAPTALLATPRDWNGTVVVSVCPEGRAALSRSRGESEPDALGLHAAILRGGAGLLLLDPLLVGAKDEARLPVHEGRHERFVGYTWGYNRTLLAERVHDVLTAIGFARDLPGATRVHLLGLGDAGPWAILASALADDAVTRTAADRARIFDEVDSLDDPSFLPGARKYGGMPSITALLSSGELRVLEGRRLDPELARWLTETP